MRRHNRLCSGGKRSFQGGNIQIILRDRHVYKYRHGPILHNGRHCCRKTRSDCDHFVSPPDSSVTEERGSQRHERKQIGRRAGIYQRTETDAKVVRKSLFKPFRIPPGGQPEFQGAVHQRSHFPAVIYTARVGNPLSLHKRIRLIMIGFTILFHLFQNLFSGLLFIHILKHPPSPFPLISSTALCSASTAPPDIPYRAAYP